MTDLPTLPPEDEDEALAAEFVLGVLPLQERILAGARLGSDNNFANRVTAWENRLAPLNDAFAPAPAPNLLPRIEARLFPSQAKPRRGLRWSFLGGVAAALLLLAFLVLPERSPVGPVLTATLTDPAQQLSFNATVDQGRDELTLVRTGGSTAPTGQDQELWAIGSDGTPRPLGLLREAETVITGSGLAPGIVLAVSLEPEGGSPTGLPTGPVLVTGVLSGPITNP